MPLEWSRVADRRAGGEHREGKGQGTDSFHDGCLAGNLLARIFRNILSIRTLVHRSLFHR